MDKLFANLTGNDKKKEQRKKDDADNNAWRGGRAGDMESMKKNNRIGGGGGNNSNKGFGSVGKKDGSGSTGGSNNKGNSSNNNLFANAGANINEALGKIDFLNKMNSSSSKNMRGGGQSLGGSRPGRVLSVSLEDPGPLGMEIERRKNAQGSAIISSVVPNSQAHAAGLLRGDIICHPRSNGDQEIMYDQFLSMARSGRRPLRFDVRRIESIAGGGTSGTAGATAASGARASGSDGARVSADAYARKQAVIAAAEAREAKHKAKTKPVPKSNSADRFPGKDRLAPKQTYQAPEQQNIDEQETSEETQRAIAAIKQAEKDDAVILGYNPYESRNMTSGQARTATVAMTRGEINAGNAPSKMSGNGAGNNGGDTMNTPGVVNAPRDPTTSQPQQQQSQPVNSKGIPPSPAFEQSFAIFVTSNPDHSLVLKSIGIMRKLVVNAITKGQQGEDEKSTKFRRVRLTNPKIREAITDMNGGLELMMSMGFVLSENEDDGDTYLVFPPGFKGEDWLGEALKQMEAYENGGS